MATTFRLGQPRPARRGRRHVPGSTARPTSTRAVAAAADAQRAWARRPVPARAEVIAAAGERARRAQGPSSPTSWPGRRARCSSRPAATCRRPSTWPASSPARAAAGLGRDRAVRAGRQAGLDDPPARRRGRDDHAVELPGRHPVVEDLPGAAGGQRHRAQAVASTRPACCEAFVAACVEAGVPAGLIQVVHGYAEPAAALAVAPRRRRGQLHRLGAHRPQGGGRGHGDRAPARVARARRQERHGRAGRRRPRPGGRRRGVRRLRHRRASAAPRPPG